MKHLLVPSIVQEMPYPRSPNYTSRGQYYDGAHCTDEKTKAWRK